MLTFTNPGNIDYNLVGITDDDRHCQRATVERDEHLTIYAEIEVEAA